MLVAVETSRLHSKFSSVGLPEVNERNRYDGPVACTTVFGETPTPAGAEQEAFTVFLRPDLIGGTFVRLHATFPSEELTTIT
jgi:hypothetical protein